MPRWLVFRKEKKMDWHDYFRNDKMLIALLIVLAGAAWIYTRNDKIFDLVTMFSGALIALITGTVLRGRNGTQPPPPPPEK